MKCTETALKDVFVFDPDVIVDHRGFFMETWRKEWFAEIFPEGEFVQDNQSKSSKGILRGLHYQIHHAQGKFIQALDGSIFDVAVDLRKSSPNYGKWAGEILSSENKRMLWVPPGFAHGFYVMSETAVISYKCTDYYHPEYEKSIIWNDSDIGIEWPLQDDEVILSAKDAAGGLFKDAETYD